MSSAEMELLSKDGRVRIIVSQKDVAPLSWDTGCVSGCVIQIINTRSDKFAARLFIHDIRAWWFYGLQDTCEYKMWLIGAKVKSIKVGGEWFNVLDDEMNLFEMIKWKNVKYI